MRLPPRPLFLPVRSWNACARRTEHANAKNEREFFRRFLPARRAPARNLYFYIADHGAESRAEHFVHRIVDHCISLSTFPDRGTKRDDIRPGLRTSSFVRRVTVAYSVDHAAQALVILGVFYGGQNYGALLQEPGD